MFPWKLFQGIVAPQKKTPRFYFNPVPAEPATFLNENLIWRIPGVQRMNKTFPRNFFVYCKNAEPCFCQELNLAVIVLT